MSLTVDVSTEGTRIPLARARVAEIACRALRAEGIRDAVLSITFLSNPRMAALNQRHLGHRGATDVISFGFMKPVGANVPVMGDVYIAPAVARANAAAHGAPVRAELARLVIHGVLHVLGYDHPDGAAREQSRMWRRQEALLHRVLTPTAR